MNAIESLMLPTLAADPAGAIISANSGDNPQETGVSVDFDQMFTLSLELTGKPDGATHVQVPHLPGGKILPVEDGEELPGYAEAIPQDGEHPLLAQVAATNTQVAPELIVRQADAPDVGSAAAVKDNTPSSRIGTLRASERQSEYALNRVPQQTQENPSEAKSSVGEQPLDGLKATVAPASPLTAKLHLPEMPFGKPPPAQYYSAPVIRLSDAHGSFAEAPVGAAKTTETAFTADILRNFDKAQAAKSSGTAVHAQVEGAETAPQRAPQAANTNPPAQPTTTPAPIPITAEAQRPAPPANGTDAMPTATPAPQRYDFTQVVDRLAEARELARPGRAEMQVMHREFGQVSMHLDVSGGALKVALTNANADFGLAVHAALAKHVANANPETIRAETIRPDVAGPQAGQTASQSSTPQQHSTTPAGSFASQQQSEGQQRQQDTQRGHTVQSQTREQGSNREDEATARSNPKRDTALFA